MKTSARIAALILSGTILSASIMNAVPRGRPDPRFVQPEQIDPAQGVEVLEAFRSARTAGDYIFHFVMENRPHKGKSETITGTMAGTWNARGEAVTRCDLYMTREIVHLLYQGGIDGKIYKASNEDQAALLDDEATQQPIVEGLTFTPFELQMPFLFWTDYVYEGTKKLLGRPAHYFILYPPGNFEHPEICAVRVAIDADFMVMLMAEELGSDGQAIKEFRINGFKKIDGQWIVKEIDLVDRQSKNRSRFKVIEADVALDLAESIFKVAPGGNLAPIPALGE